MTLRTTGILHPTSDEEMVRIGPLRALRWMPSDMKAPNSFLLVHGMGAGAHVWRRLGPFLASHGYASHAVWLRHHHPGADPDQLDGLGIQEYAADVVAAAHDLGRPILAGHSSGGLVAQVAAMSFATPGIALLSSTAPFGIPTLHHGWHTARALPAFVGSPVGAGPFIPDARYMRRVHLNGLDTADADAILEHWVAEPRRFVRQVAFWPPHIPRSAIRCPVLVASGSDDLCVIPWVARRLAARYRVVASIYPGRAHLPQLEPGWQDVACDFINWADRFAE